MKVKGFFLRALLAVAMILPLASRAQQVVSFNDYTVSRSTQGMTSLFEINDPNVVWYIGTTSATVSAPAGFTMDLGDANDLTAPTFTADLNGALTIGTNVIKPLYYSAGFAATDTSFASLVNDSVIVIEWHVAKGTDTLNFQVMMNRLGTIEFRYGLMDNLTGSINVQVGVENTTTSARRYLTGWGSSPLTNNSVNNIALAAGANNNPHAAWNIKYAYDFNRYCYHTMIDSVCKGVDPTYYWNFDYYASDPLQKHYYLEGTAPTVDQHYGGTKFDIQGLYANSGADHDTMLSYLIVDTNVVTDLPNMNALYTEHCEHIGVMTLHIGQSTVIPDTITACDTYTWIDGITYTASDDYKFEGLNPNNENCDSVFTLHLTINASSAASVDVTACDTYTWNVADFGGANPQSNVYTTTGVYNVTVENAAGCDSVITLNLTINASSTSSEAQDVCDTYTWNIADFGGANPQTNTYTATGVYTDTVMNAVGCDSVMTLNLTVRYSTDTVMAAVTGCETYTWSVADFGGSNPLDSTHTIAVNSSARLYKDTLHVVNEAGCDSAIYLTLTLHPVLQQNYCVKAIGFYEWAANDSVYDYTTTVSALDTHSVAGVTAAGCDSLHIIDLTLFDMPRDTVCGGYYQGVYYTRDTTLIESTTYTVAGCDSIDRRAVDIISRQYHIVRVWANQSIDWPEAPYQNTYSDSTSVLNPPFHNRTSEVNGCDSTWFLYYLPETNSPMHLCAEQFDNNGLYEYRGFQIPLTAATPNNPTPSQYTDTLKFVTDPLTMVHDTVQFSLDGATSMKNVDSMYVIILDLFIHDYTTTPAIDAKDTCVLFNPNDLTASTHTFIYGDATKYYGVDTLTIVAADGSTLIDTNITFTSITGCDSIVNLQLTVNPIYKQTLSVKEHCEFAPYTNGLISIPAGQITPDPATEAFIYIDTLATVAGCDSIVTIEFSEIHTGTTVKDTVHYCELPTLPMTFSNGDNSVAYTINDTADFYANFNTYLDYPDTNEVTSSTFDVTVAKADGCDSVITVTMIGHGAIFDTNSLITNSDAHFLYRGVMYNVPSWAEWIDTTIVYAEAGDVNEYGCQINHVQRLLVGRRNINSWNVDECAQYNWTIRGYFLDENGNPVLKDSTRTFIYLERDAAHLNVNPWYVEVLPGGLRDTITTYPEIHHLQSNMIFDSVDRLELTLAEGTSTFDTVTIDADSLYYATNGYVYTVSSASEDGLSIVNRDVDFSLARTAMHDSIYDTLFSHKFTSRWCDSISNIHLIYDYQTVNTTVDTVVYMSEIERITGTDTHWVFTYDGNDFYFDSVMTNTTHTASFDTVLVYDMEHYTGMTVADSVVNLNIAVIHNYDTLGIDTVCAEQLVYTLDSTTVANVLFDAATNAMDIDATANGIQINLIHVNMDLDTTYIIDYTVLYPAATARGNYPVKYHAELFQLRRIYGTDYELACDDFTWINGVTYTESTTIPTYVMQGASYRHNCDSVVTLNLTVVRSSYDTTVAYNTNTVPGVMEYYWIDANAIAHNIAHTNYNPATDAYDINEVSNHFVFKEVTTDTVVYLNEIHASALNGCDSVLTVALHLMAPHYVDTLVYVCEDSYTWPVNSKTYTWDQVTRKFVNASDIYNDSAFVDTIIASYYTEGPIDTVLRLQLIKSRHTYGIDFAGENCDSYTWTLYEFDSTPVTVGTFTQSYHAPYSPSYALHNNPNTGCDSIVYLDLTINDSVVTYDSILICEAALPYTYNYDGTDTNLVAAGTYRLVTAHPVTTCDSIQYFKLKVQTPVIDTPMFVGFDGNPTTDTMICLGTDMTYKSVTMFYGDTTKQWHYFVDGLYTILDTVWKDIMGTPTDPTDDCIDTIYKINVRVLPTTYRAMPEVVSCNPVYEWYVDELNYRLAYKYNPATYTGIMPRGHFLAATFYGDSVATTIIVNQYGCDSVITQPFRTSTINQFTATDTIEVCAANLPYNYLFHGVNYTITSDTTIEYQATGLLGCDTVYRQPFVIRNATAYTDVQTACDTYTWIDGITYTASTNTPQFTIPNQYGCDSVITLNLTVNYSNGSLFNVTACNVYTWAENGHNYLASNNTDYVTLTNQYGCDSTITLNLTINYTSNGTDSQVACDTYTWIDGNTYTNSITGPQFTLVGADVNGCDSIVTLDLTINRSTSSTSSVTACDSYVWNVADFDGSNPQTNSFTTSGNYSTIVKNAVGCDSVMKLNLVINNSVAYTDVQTACDSYIWGADGNTYTTTGTYGPVVLLTNAGCDSTVTLNLTVNASDHMVFNATACDLYTWAENGQMYNVSNNTDFVTYTNQYGCDSIITLNLTVNYKTYGVDSQVACDSYTWMDGNTYNYSINGPVHVLVGANANGCDSVVTLNLVVNHKTYGTENVIACDSYTWHGTTYTASNHTAQYTYANGNAVGCDSVVTLNLTVHYSATSIDNIVACDSYTWTNGVTYWASTNTPTDTFSTAYLCDSIVTLHLVINNSTVGTDVQTACDSYTWLNGVTYTASNNSAVYHTTNAAGCDSTITLNLTVNYSTASTETHVACDSYVWPLNGQAYIASTNTPSVTLTTVDGCDSVVTLNLTVNHSTASTQNVTVCDSYQWADGNTYTNSGIYTYTATNAAGCDSNMTLFLTVRGASTGVQTVIACDSYTWYGTTYTASTNTPTHTLSAADQYGCDSIITLNLTINNSTSGSQNVTACDSYSWNGTTYYASTVATHHFTNVAGCDSTATLYLTINNSTNATVTATACDSYTWHGTTFTSSTNNATYHTTNAAGCDSTVTLNLTINHSTSSSVLVNACDSYTWHGTTYTASTNTATYNTTNAAGCDSVVTLHLTINNSSAATQTVSACDSYTWMNGVTYTASTNTPTYTITNAAGCDSVITLNLTILPSASSTDVQTACDSYTWINGVTYSSSINNGSVTYTTTAANGCDSVITLQLTIYNSVVNSETVTACDSYTWNGTTYTVSGDYTAALTTVHGCDSVVTLHLTINYSNTGSETVQAVGSYDWHGTTYTATGAYTWTGTNAAGCDSVVTLNLTIVSNSKPLPEIIAYNGKVLMLNHYPDGKESGERVDYDSYQWYKDGVAIDGATLDYFNEANYADLSGCYYVMVPIDNVMVASNTICFGNDGIDDVDALEVSFTVAPNPVASGNMMKVETTLDESQLQGATLVMFDIRGRKVMEMPMERSTIMVNVNQVSGAYMLRLTTKSGATAVKKVIVK